MTILPTVNKLLFSEWLLNEMDRRGFSQADLSRKSKMSTGAISNLINQVRKPSPDACNAIAKALDIPPEEVFIIAGLLPPKPEKDELTEEAEYLLAQMPEDKREQAIRFIRFLSQEGNHENTSAKSMGGAK